MNQRFFPVSQMPYLTEAPTPQADLRTRLTRDIDNIYGQVRHIRDLNVKTGWRMARDLVYAVDRWSGPVQTVSGPDKMDIVLDVAWAFADRRGGVSAIRDMIAGHVPILPRFASRWMLGRILNKKTARRLIEFVMELAVREMKDSGAADA